MQAEGPAWFKRRSYPHFDHPLTAEMAERLVTDPAAIAQRAFLPFIRFDLVQRRGKRREGGKGRRFKKKKRSVAFASHVDSHVFAYYAHQLQALYLKRLRKNSTLDECVLAYRRFDPPKCNIHFAQEVFTHVLDRGPCSAVAMDIEGFFDNLPHADLKRQWAGLLGQSGLPDDHYAVFRAVTRWASVKQSTLMKTLGIGRRRRENWRGPLCTPKEFREKVRAAGLIEVHKDKKGIPQGSPISAVLSNIVMLDVDDEMSRLAAEQNVLYRRYSDDILLVGSQEGCCVLEARFEILMKGLGLAVNGDKTVRSRFTLVPQASADCSAEEASKACRLVADKPLQYLGFTFDGERILIRSQTMAKYIRRMKQAVRSAERAAKKASGSGGSRKLRRQDLYARFSHLGPTKIMREKDKGKKGAGMNFWRYSKKAAEVMGRDEIGRQLRKHWPRLNKMIQFADEDPKSRCGGRVTAETAEVKGDSPQ